MTTTCARRRFASPGMVAALVARPVRVGDDDLEVGTVERQVVVAAVPDDDVGLLLGLGQDRRVVHARVDDGARVDVRLVLLALLDRALVAVEVLERRRSAARAGAPGRRRASGGARTTTRRPRARRIAATRRVVWLLPLPVRTAQTETTGTRAASMRGLRAEQPEVGAAGEHPRGLVHHGLVRHVAVGEDHLVDLQLADQLAQLRLGVDRDALGIERAGQLRRVAAALRCRESGWR